MNVKKLIADAQRSSEFNRAFARAFDLDAHERLALGAENLHPFVLSDEDKEDLWLLDYEQQQINKARSDGAIFEL